MPTPARKRTTTDAGKTADGRILMDFFDAMRFVRDGAKVTRLAWGVDDSVFMHAERLHLRKADGTLHQLMVSVGDMDGTDWVLVREN